MGMKCDGYNKKLDPIKNMRKYAGNQSNKNVPGHPGTNIKLYDDRRQYDTETHPTNHWQEQFHHIPNLKLLH